MSVDLEWKAAYRQIRWLNWVTLLVMSGAGALLLAPEMAAGIVLGGMVMIANFGLLQHTIRRAFSQEGTMTATKASVILKYYFRLLGLGVILFFLIKQGWVHPVGLAIGVSTILVSLVAFGIKRVCKTYIREAT